MFRRAKFLISKVILIYILEMMIFFKLVGSNLVPLCRQSFSMAMANQLHLLFKRKTKPFNRIGSTFVLSMLPFGFHIGDLL